VSSEVVDFLNFIAYIYTSTFFINPLCYGIYTYFIPTTNLPGAAQNPRIDANKAVKAVKEGKIPTFSYLYTLNVDYQTINYRSAKLYQVC